jgi:hypothetical protein
MVNRGKEGWRLKLHKLVVVIGSDKLVGFNSSLISGSLLRGGDRRHEYLRGKLDAKICRLR